MEAPSENLEERLAEAADVVLTEQANAESGDGLLAQNEKGAPVKGSEQPSRQTAD